MKRTGREPTMCGLALAAVLSLPGLALGRAPQEAATITAQEQSLWERVAEAMRPVPTTQPFKEWFDAARQRRRTLLSRVRLYLTLYPGGAYRDEAIGQELTALFEIGTLRGGLLEGLSQRVAEVLRAPPSEAALHEAAYWRMMCERSTPADAGDSSASATGLDDAERGAHREYVRAYPRSRHVPRLGGLLFEEAARTGDRTTMAELVALLSERFPQHPMTAAVVGKWRRLSAAGEPFQPALRTIDNKDIEWSTHQGQPVLIVVWAGFDEAARRCVLRVEHFRAGHPEVQVIGVGLDESPDRTLAVSRELEITWPQCNDGRGWGGEFVRHWGIDRVPHVLVIDRMGRLVGSASGDDWDALARQAVRDEAPAADAGEGPD